MNLYGIIGFPLTHSFSKQYFTTKFEKEGLQDCRYETFPISHIGELEQVLDLHPDLRGLSVTIPHKESVLPWCHWHSDEVKEIGATNSIRIANGRLEAFNTDCMGFEQSIKTLLQAQDTGALVLGSGGSSKAIQYVLRRLGLNYFVISRNPTGSQLTYSQLSKEIIQSHRVIINCTPVGMTPNEHDAPDIPYEWLDEQNLLFDLIYKPAKTLFLQKGEARGCRIKNGFEMLLLQAEASWKIWNNAIE